MLRKHDDIIFNKNKTHVFIVEIHFNLNKTLLNSISMKKRILFLFMSLCLFITSYAQVQVRGIVRDILGDPIPGVTIVEKGTQHGVITDMDGNYYITVAGPESILQYSFVGMDTWEVVVGNQSIINAVLQETATDLDEIVVVGYGTMRKSDISGAISSVRSDALENIVTSDAAAALQDRRLRVCRYYQILVLLVRVPVFVYVDTLPIRVILARFLLLTDYRLIISNT